MCGLATVSPSLHWHRDTAIGNHIKPIEVLQNCPHSWNAKGSHEMRPAILNNMRSQIWSNISQYAYCSLSKPCAFLSARIFASPMLNRFCLNIFTRPGHLIIKKRHCLTGTWIPVIHLRRWSDRLRFIMGITMKRCLLGIYQNITVTLWPFVST